MPLGAARINTIGRYFELAPSGPRSALTFTATNDAKISTAQSKFGGASAVFDGNGDSVTAIDSGVSLGNSNWTIEYWLRAASTSSNPTIFDTRSGTGDTSGYSDYINSSGKFVIFMNSSDRITSSTTISTNTWYHIAIVRDSSKDIKLYINGTNEGSTYNHTANMTSDDWIIGRNVNSSTFLNGYVDEVRVSKIARYTANFTAPTAAFTNDSDTVLLLHMDGTNNSTSFPDDNGDRFRSGISAINNAQVDTAQSKFGGASALFDGAGDYLISSPGQGFSTNNFTIEFWVRFNSTGANQLIASGYPAGSPNLNWAFWMGSSNTFQYFLSSTGTTWDIASGVTIATVTTNTWYHVALVRDGNTFTPYLDGTAGTTTTSSSALYFNNTNWYIGGNTSNVMNGWIDELRISDIARYTGNFTAPTTAFTNDSDTVLLIHCDGADATTNFLDDNGAS